MSTKYSYFDGDGKTHGVKVDGKMMYYVECLETGQVTKLYYHLWDAVQDFEKGDFISGVHDL